MPGDEVGATKPTGQLPKATRDESGHISMVLVSVA